MQMTGKLRFKFLGYVVLMGLMTLVSSCWSARCPRETCKVRVEHRHGESYYRPRAAFSWMWTPRYKHVRTGQIAGAGPNQFENKSPWYKVWGKNKNKKNQKPR